MLTARSRAARLHSLAGSLVNEVEVTIAGGAVANRYQHTDALGSPVRVTDNSRVAQGVRNEYEPFGQVLNAGIADHPGFTGHVADAKTGMDYMQQRYYDPMIGRFLSVDPVTASSVTGSNFNRYWYANNSPYKFIDPDGRVVKPTTEIVRLINQESEMRYRTDGAGNLDSTQTCNVAGGSKSYSSDIDTAISSATTITMKVQQQYALPDGTAQDVDADAGGGVTGNGGNIVMVSGNNSGADADVNGNPVVDSAASVLRHEITGHVVPILRGQSGSARDFDNVSRKELGKPELAPLPPPPNNIPDPVQ